MHDLIILVIHLVVTFAKLLPLQIDKHMVRRALASNYRPGSGTERPSWLSFIAQMKHSLWSVDLFRCESILLKSYWGMVVIDVFTRSIVGFGIEAGSLDGISLCQIFGQAVSGKPLPKRVSSDHDPLFRFHRWLVNLRVLEIEKITSVPYAPASHPLSNA
jgi:putative transposase